MTITGGRASRSPTGSSIRRPPSIGIDRSRQAEPAVREEAQRRGLRVIDATCPLVTKVHLEAIRYARENYSIILIGHEDHDEVIGTLGEAPDRIVVVDSVEEVEQLHLPDPDKHRRGRVERPQVVRGRVVHAPLEAVEHDLLRPVGDRHVHREDGHVVHRLERGAHPDFRLQGG